MRSSSLISLPTFNATHRSFRWFAASLAVNQWSDQGVTRAEDQGMCAASSPRLRPRPAVDAHEPTMQAQYAASENARDLVAALGGGHALGVSGVEAQ